MFGNVGWGEMLILVVVGLVVLGPERLPGAIQWCGTALRQARDYLGKAAGELRDEMGPDFDDLRGQFGELQKLRGMTPRAALTKHLLDGDDSIFTALSDLTRDPTALGTPAVSKAASKDTPPAPRPWSVRPEETPFDHEAT